MAHTQQLRQWLLSDSICYWLLDKTSIQNSRSAVHALVDTADLLSDPGDGVLCIPISKKYSLCLDRKTQALFTELRVGRRSVMRSQCPYIFRAHNSDNDESVATYLRILLKHRGLTHPREAWTQYASLVSA